ncbi:hypothetical protein Tco_1537982 [Tanacetum coccineum]
MRSKSPGYELSIESSRWHKMYNNVGFFLQLVTICRRNVQPLIQKLRDDQKRMKKVFEVMSGSYEQKSNQDRFGRENFYVILIPHSFIYKLKKERWRTFVTNSRVTPSWREIVSLTFRNLALTRELIIFDSACHAVDTTLVDIISLKAPVDTTLADSMGIDHHF